jgi:hypothetical protein
VQGEGLLGVARLDAVGVELEDALEHAGVRVVQASAEFFAARRMK